jgi:hypothetical protein
MSPPADRSACGASLKVWTHLRDAIDVVDGGQHNLVVATVPGDLDDLEA